MTLATKDEALDALEQARKDYVTAARSAAERMCPVGECITVNDVRGVFPPPDCIDPRVMGAILRAPQWVVVGYVGSKRRVSHKRPVARFQRAY